MPGAGHGCVSVWKLTSERHRIDGVEPHATEQATFDSHAGAYLGVAQGASSDNEAQFIHLTYKRGVPKTKLAIVGKGLTYDSGGYNLKPSAGGMIELMKFDMGGALAASRRVEAPSLPQYDSCPSHKEVGGFFVEFEAILTPRRSRP